MTLRVAARPDLAALLGLWEQLMAAGAEGDARYVTGANARDEMRATIRDTWFIDKPFPRVWLAEHDAVPVGYIQGHEVAPHPIVASPPKAKIGDMFVVPSARRSGVGRALVEAWMGSARAAGIEMFEVGTLARDARAVAFWRSMGFGDWMVTLRR